MVIFYIFIVSWIRVFDNSIEISIDLILALLSTELVAVIIYALCKGELK